MAPDIASTGLWSLLDFLPEDFTGWHTVISASLLREVKEWNDAGTPLLNWKHHRPDPDDLHAFWSQEQELASRIQSELGPRWEVLYASAGAWTWVTPPKAWRK